MSVIVAVSRNVSWDHGMRHTGVLVFEKRYNDEYLLIIVDTGKIGMKTIGQ